MVCYEDILVSFAHRLGGLDPDVLINITNDAWFGKTSEPYLHLNLSVMRSIETHKSLLRSTNTGVSAVIDPVGRLVASTGLDDMETVLEQVPMMTGVTVYQRVGGIVAYLVVIWSVVAVFARRRRKKGRAT